MLFRSREGLTEAAQQAVTETAASLASGNDLFTAERGMRVLESGVQGGLAGGAMGGAAGVTPDRAQAAPTVQAVPDGAVPAGKVIGTDPFADLTPAAETQAPPEVVPVERVTVAPEPQQPASVTEPAQTEPLFDEAGQQIGRWNPVTGEIVRGDAAPAQTAGPVAEPLPAPVTPADVASPLETRDISEGKALIGELLGESPQRPVSIEATAAPAQKLGIAARQEPPQDAVTEPVTLPARAPEIAPQTEVAQAPAEVQALPATPSPAPASEVPTAPTLYRRADGAPYGSEKSAALSARQRADLKGRDLEPVQIEGGWALRERPSAEASRAAPAIIETPADMRVASQVVNTEPSDAQKAAGNYRKAHVRLGGLDIAIETPRGATRSGVDPDGQPWSVTQPADYGYIKRSQGADGDQLDVYVGPDPQAQQVYVIDQRDANTGQFDELKVMMGFPSQDQAVQTYQAAFSDGRAGERMGAVTPMSMDQFRAWLKDGDTTKPVASQQMATPTPAPAERSPAPAQVQPPAAVASPPSGALSPEVSASAEADPIAFRASANRPQSNIAGMERQARDTAITDFVRQVQQDAAGEAALDLGVTTIADRIKADTGIDVAGFTHVLDRSGVRHAIKQHGDPKREAARGQLPVTEADFALLPEVLANPDTIENAGKTKQGRDAIRYSKAIGDQIFYVEEVRTGRKRLAPVTMYKRPIDGGRATTPDAPQPAAPAASPAQTPEAFRDPLPNMAQAEAVGNRKRPSVSPAARQGKAEDLASFLARNGGIRDDEGHSLRKLRNLQRMTQHGPMVRAKGGLSIDDAGEALWQEGFFGPPDTIDRPTEAQVLDMLERLQTERRVYRPEEGRAIASNTSDARAADMNQAARDDIRGIAREIGERLSQAEIDEIVDIMGERGIDADTAVSDYVERKAIVEADRNAAEAEDDTYAEDIPFEGLASDSRQSGASIQGRTAVAGAASGVGEGGSPSAEGQGAGRGQGQPVTLRTERTDQGDQFVLPGATRIQDSGRPLRGRGPQRAADEGLFAPPSGKQDELFSFSPQVTDRFTAAAPEIERNLRARLDRLGLSDRVGLRVTDMIRSLVTGQDVPGAVGMYSSTDAQRLIQVSTAAPSPGAILHHEALHAMREMGLFSEREWQVLDRTAKADRERTAKIERAYAGQLDGMDPAARADILTEEVIADMYADWSDGRLQAQGALETLFQRIRNFLRALRNALAGNGFRTERDVFQAMDRGEIGSREELPPIEPAERTQAENEARVERMAISSAANRTGLPPGLDLSTPRRSVVEVLNDSTLPILRRLKQGGKPDAIAEQVDRWRATLQDQFLPLLRTQAKVEAATGRKLDVSSDPYLQQELSSGRIGARLEDLTEQHVRPLYEDMHAAGISVEDLEAYLYARHAPERNKRISSINPKFGPGEGSGMTDADAAAIIKGVKASGKQAAYDAAAKRVDAILNMALETRVQAGLLSRQEADAWKATYQHYVPLRGKAELDPEVAADRPSTGGSGVTVRGRESYRAFGRETKAADILAYSIMQAEEAILRAETNEVAKAFYQLAKDNPDAGLWQADKVEMRPVLDKVSGQVRYQRSSQISAEDKDYTVTAKIDGKEHRVTLNRENPVAIRLASAMRNLDGSQFGAWVRTVGSINRYLSTVNTTLNPEFMVVNAFRDLQTAGINLQQFDIPKLTRNTLKDYPAALKASMKGSFGQRGGDAWSKWFQEYRASGAPVSFNRMEDINAIRSRIRADFAAAGPGLSARKAWRGVWGTIENLNMGVEQAVRLAAYKNAREAGMSVERAASLAKNMTVNFNRKGSAGPIINSLYLFYNAGVQGTAALLSAAKSPRVRKVLYGAVLAGAMLEIYNQMAGDDDDDGEAFYRKISENDKQRNLIVMLPGRGGEHIKIPLPYGYNVFYTLGRLAIATATGEKNAARAGVDLLTATLDSFNPIGGSGSLLNIIAPTIADPVVDLTRNRDYADRPIMPEPSPYTTPEPDSSTYWNNVSTPSKAFTSWLNEATGGDDVQPGAIDISPETLDYMAGFATGAAGSFFGRIVDLGAKMFDPQGEITANDLPLTRKVLGGKPGWYDKAAFYERAKQVDEAVDFLKRYEDAGNMDAADRYAAEKANLLDMEKPVRQTRKALSDIRKERAALRQDLDLGNIARDAYDKEMEALKADEQAELSAFNRDYLEWVGKD